MRIRVAIAGAGMALAGMAGAQQPAPTVQQQFEAATALAEKGDNAGALAAWTALDGRTATNKRSHAIVLVRKSAALLALDHKDEAVAAARAGLAGLPAGDASLAEDRVRANMILGQIATITLDYAGAAAAFEQAEASASIPADKLGAMIGLIQAQTFTDPKAAMATLARSDAFVKTIKVADPIAALVARRRTVLLLNTGNIGQAKASALDAVKLLGGLTDRTDTVDVSARSDVAIAMLLGSGDPDEARRYMAYTGAGQLSKGSFDPGAEMRPPDCGGEAGLKPDDVAVVEFSIAPDGSIARATPVYAAGGGTVALEFARAVNNWFWPADKVQQIPEFFRYNARVEMRCSTAFERPSISDALDGALEQWLAAKGVTFAPEPTGPQAAAIVGQRADLAKAEAQSPTSLGTLAAIYRLTTNPAVPREDRAALYARGLAIAIANDAPAEARLALDLPARSTTTADIWKPGFYERAVSPMLSETVYAGDPQARAAIRLKLADSADASNRRAAKNERALLLLRQVADDKALKPNDPFRVGALVRIASIEQRNGQVDAARAAFESSGLTANQCAIMDAPPKMVSTPGAEAFPLEALRWGFEGWTQVQYDVGADGKALNQRPLLSYPPFIFSKAGTRFFENAKFAKTYRPDGGLGCGATTTRVKFVLPERAH